MIDKKIVQHVALLSRLKLNAEELELYSRQLASILSYISQLDGLDTSKTIPTSHALSSLKNAFRKDEIRPSLQVNEVLANAPEWSGDFFKIPKVIEGK